MRPPWAFLGLVAGSSLVCVSPGSVPHDPSDPALGSPSLLSRSAPASPETLAFPPPDSGGRRARGAMPVNPTSYREDGPVRVIEPELDGKGQFDVASHRVRIVFSAPMARPEPKARTAAEAARGAQQPGTLQAEPDVREAKPGTLRISPEIPGQTRWLSATILEFIADRPIPPGTTYGVELGDVKTTAGEPLASGWTATLMGRAAIAGKILSYVPKTGDPRPIAVRPDDDSKVGRSPKLAVLFDQPVPLGRAQALVELVDDHGKAIPLALDHPPSPTFEGIKVDPRYVVLAAPRQPLAAGRHYKLVASSPGGGASRRAPLCSQTRNALGGCVEQKESEFTVADPLVHTGVECGWGARDRVCEWSSGRLRTSAQEVHVLFNNPIARGESLEHRVHVTPKVRNLSVRNYDWDGRLLLSGAFDSSTNYQVTIDSVRDQFGGKLAQPVSFQVATTPIDASVSMPEGLLVLDEATSKRFIITSRNVAEAELLLWPVPAGDAPAFERAFAQTRMHTRPDDAPAITIAIPVVAGRNQLVESPINLLEKLSAGTSYLATLAIKKPAFGAEPARYERHSEASRPPIALLTPGNTKSLAVHARSLANATLVHVARLSTGMPVAGATLELAPTVVAASADAIPGAAPAAGGNGPASVITDASGMALIPGNHEGLLRVRASDAEMQIPLNNNGMGAKQLFPELTSGSDAARSGMRAMVMTDRGIYRPGSKVWVKANLRRPEGDRLVAVSGAEVRVHVVGPTGDDVSTEMQTTSDTGGVATSFTLPKDAKLGRHQLLIEPSNDPGSPLALTILQVAEFEPPRFVVDVDATVAAGALASRDASQLRANIRGRYLFGAPMDGARVSWTLKREPAPLPPGPFTDAGLLFRPRPPSWYEQPQSDAWSRSGEGTLGTSGVLELSQPLSLTGAVGPQRFVIEADVTDSSHRHIAGRGEVTANPHPRYAGVRAVKRWAEPGEDVPVELAVMDTEGKPVIGASVTARLDHVSFHYVRRRAAGGAVRWEWSTRRTAAARCTVKSAIAPVSCKLTPSRLGQYEITAEVDGRSGGALSLWSWDDDHESGDAPRVPSRGRAVEIVADKARYAPGDTAKLLVRSPYPAATAILTVEQGDLLEHRSRRIEGGAALIEVPLTAAHAPHVHATVTLLPIGAKGEAIADYRIGAVRLPVSLSGARLDVAIQSKATYGPGEEAEITVDVKDNGKPVTSAEIVLAIVDEGVLRLTNFHAPDPVQALRPGRALSFHLRDSREALADLFERSHVAGDGGGGEGQTQSGARRNFVETALWRPDLRTDAAGRASVKLRLPDNLTQFRVMAVAIDEAGKGAAAEGEFTVKKPVMLVPIVPRFASVGDHFEAAAMVHNNTDKPLDLTISLGSATRAAAVAPGGHQRVGFPITAEKPGEMQLDFKVSSGSGPALDRVEARVPTMDPGIDERPRLEGTFARHQEIALTIPASVSEGAEALTIRVGQHLWPELGARVEYLIDYPHGCVEQTTSSTLPLLAARQIFPRIGFTRFGDADLKKKIQAGLERLRTMRTAGGGLGYWPGDDEPNVYGTAYAIRAVVLARGAGIAPPSGLLEGMERYLTEHMLDPSLPPEVQAAIAQSLAELGHLPSSSADALYDRRGQQTVFGLASLAMALNTLPGQTERVEALLDSVEAGFDDEGKLTRTPSRDDFHYFGSPTRTSAQAAMALARLRRGSKLLPGLVNELARGTESYTTQATAYSLLAVAEQLTTATKAGAEVRAFLDGVALPEARDLGFGSGEMTIPLSSLRGRKAMLRLESSGDAAVGFLMSAGWRRPSEQAGSLAATSTPAAPELFRVFTDAKGEPVDLGRVRAGDVVRVALLARMPAQVRDRDRSGYLAVTDHLPAGFEPIQPDLATVASVPELTEAHPFASMLRWGENAASHVELHDDRVNLYFDRVSGEFAVATYLVRASTPGSFVVPPAAAELMYEPNSMGYSDAARVVVQ